PRVAARYLKGSPSRETAQFMRAVDGETSHWGRGLTMRLHRQRVRGTGAMAVFALTGSLVVSSVAATKDRAAIFRPFRVPWGSVQSTTVDQSLDGSNAFFAPGLGTNGQACVTCHQPDQGFTITVPFIRDAFEASSGLDPLFRANDTADRPDADLSTPEA